SGMHVRVAMVVAVLNIEGISSRAEQFTRTATQLRFEELGPLAESDPMYPVFREAMFTGDSTAFLADPINAQIAEAVIARDAHRALEIALTL
ncbi:MAG: hypothetical protein AAFO93_15890, partial [Pseudomonadota bacterium]